LTNLNPYDIINIENEREVSNMREVRYEYNGQMYKTRAEAPKDAKVILENVKAEKPKYNAKKVAKLRELARAKKSD
jgi:3-methyladenine DNA glycosylase AlkC